jgi:hypothetical protein
MAKEGPMSRYIRELFEKGDTFVLSVEGIYHNDPMLFEVLRSFLSKNYALENILFWEACMRGDSVETLVKQYLVVGAKHEVNIPAESRDEVLEHTPPEWLPDGWTPGAKTPAGYMEMTKEELDLMGNDPDDSDDEEEDDD